MFNLSNNSVFDFIFLLAAPLVYLYPSYRLITAITIISVPALIFICRLDPLNALLSASFFGAIQACAAVSKNILERERGDLESEMKEEEKKKSGLLEKLKTLEDEERGVREDEFMLVNLFEITRKMSENLRFADIFNVFSAFLKGSFSFRKCDLLVLNRDDPKFPHLERSYSVWREGNEETSKQITNYDKLIKSFLENPQKIHASKKSDAKILEEIGVEDPGVGTFTAIPLFNEDKLAAILTVENLPTEELEGFLILSMQFALEIKKVPASL